MTKQDVIQGYKTEIAYQKKMLANLGRWFSLSFGLTSGGIVMLVFPTQQLLLRLLGILLLPTGLLGMLLVGYALSRGKQNLIRVIDDLQLKLQAFEE
ncbi:hypothetical protein [Streptococcus halichoeri]|uniref:hypothetical protein n=1 Tax=Streptococcus halichoeri TaxID=254785 RepID=UPI0013567D23|nr:hypothetical protein [Streptococcus halichoeri]